MPKERRRDEKPPWLEYYKTTSKWPPADTLTKALSLFHAEESVKGVRFAIDLGCGSGRDTFELLRRGWKVLAVDNEPEAIQWIRSGTKPKFKARLKTRLASFEKMRFPKCDLVNGSYSLPFCTPNHFASFWRRILSSMRPGARFSGQLFGQRDEWARDPQMTFHTVGEVKAMLRNLETEFYREREWDGTTASGLRKHWHVFSIVARKPSRQLKVRIKARVK